MKKVFLFLLLSLLSANLCFGKWLNTVTCKLAKNPSDTSSVDSVVHVGSSTFVHMLGLSDSCIDRSVNNYVSLNFEPFNNHFIGQDYSIIVGVQIDCYDANNQLMIDISDASKLFEINVPAFGSRNSPINKSEITFNGAYKIVLTVNAITINGVTSSTNILPDFVSINGGISVERIFNIRNGISFNLNATGANFNGNSFNFNLSSAFLNIDCDPSDVNDEIYIYWDDFINAEEYQLEWTFINDYSRGFSNPNLSQTIDYSFKNNSTRVSLKTTSYFIPNIFDRGYLVFRIRAIGRDLTNPDLIVYGNWQGSSETGSFVNLTPNAPAVFLYIDQSNLHNIDMNWQLTTSFAEEGKKKDVISYFDGALKSRQAVTRINDNFRAIVGETIYDHIGRPAINVLPVPVGLSNCSLVLGGLTNATPLKYYENFNNNLNSTSGNLYPYTYLDFDLSPGAQDCDIAVGPMSTLSGASNYYSSSNEQKSSGFNSYIPAAKRFPFSVTEYMPDNTNQIRRQGGVGLQLQLDNSISDRSTKYLYGQPSQPQLDRLFGSEVGWASYYKKNVVIDPNGQASVSYIDNSGKVIATSLAGSIPENGVELEDLPSASSSEVELIVDLFNKNSLGQSILNKLDYSKGEIYFNSNIVVTEDSPYEFDYNLSVDTLKMDCGNICFNCVYDLEIEITDDCGVSITHQATATSKELPFNKIVGRIVDLGSGVWEFDPLCSPESIFEFGEQKFVPVLLEQGTYNVTKKLTLRPDAVDYYLQAYLNEECIKTLEEFEAEELAKIDTNDCYTTCDECAEALGSLDNYLASGLGSEFEYELALEACKAPCEAPDVCSATFAQMLIDVSPNGQYGLLKYPTQSNQVLTSVDYVSVFTVPGSLPNQFAFTSANAKWRNPKYWINGKNFDGYFDESGKRAKVFITQDPFGSFFPEVHDMNKIYFDAVEGSNFVYLENLKNLSDFIDLWDYNFAKSLVCYHPEYAYYVGCSHHSLKMDGENLTSKEFDELLINTLTFSEALSKNLIYLDPALGYVPRAYYVKSSNYPYDPFFTNSFFSQIPQAFILNLVPPVTNFGLDHDISDKMNDFSNGISMVQTAAMANRCLNNFGLTPSTNCYEFGAQYYSDPVKDMELHDAEWRTFVSLYLSEKQKIQFKRLNYLSKLSTFSNTGIPLGCNECIGNKKYNPFTIFSYNYGGNHWAYWSNYSNLMNNSPLYYQEQPCGRVRYHLYRNKIKRFVPPGSVLETTPQSAQLAIYQSTGQCPLTVELQYLLNELANTNTFSSGTAVSLKTKNTYNQDLYKAFSGGTFPQIYEDYEWKYLTTVGTKSFFEVSSSGHQLCSFEFNLGLSNISIHDIVKFENIKYLSYDPSTKQYIFYIDAYVNSTIPNGIPTKMYKIIGKTCINLEDCNFQPVCTPNDLGLEIQTLINTLYNGGDIDETNFTFLQPNSTSIAYDQILDPFIPTLLSYFNVTTIKDLEWNCNTTNSVSPWQANLYAQNDPTTYLSIEFQQFNSQNNAVVVAPLNSNIPNIQYFSDITPDNYGYFSMNCLDDSDEFSTVIFGRVSAFKNGELTNVEIGSCEIPPAIDCYNNENLVRKDLSKLLKYFFENFDYVVYQNPNIIASASYIFTNLLKSYMQPPSSSFNCTMQSRDVIFENSDNPDCNLVLYRKDTTDSYLLFDITKISEIEPVITESTNGIYYNFYFIADFTNMSGSITDTVFGYSCFPLKVCDECYDIIPNDSIYDYSYDDYQIELDSGIASGELIYNPNPSLYENYLFIIDSLNEARYGQGIYINIVSYDEFIAGGFSFAIEQYLSFIINFFPDVDDPDLLDISAFVIYYGNVLNCYSQYDRWISTISVYNDYAQTNSYLAMTEVTDSMFFSWSICDSVTDYIDYVNYQMEASLPASSIYSYLNIQNYSPSSQDTCEVLYSQYIDAYLNWYGVQTDSTCLNFKILYPFHSQSVFERNNLCCSNLGYSLFLNYIASFGSYDCPEGLPYLENCESDIIGSDTSECNRMYNYLMLAIENYNQSSYAQIHNYYLNTDFIRTFDIFISKNYCECVIDYINFLTPYIYTTDSLALPYSIESFPGCSDPIAIHDTCGEKYNYYLEVINHWNSWVYEYHGDEMNAWIIEEVFSYETFVAKEYCNCLNEYDSKLTAIMDGQIVDETEILFSLLLDHACDSIPCTQEMPPLFDLPIPPVEPNPCVEMLINNALQTALINYQNYITELSANFVNLYTAKCLSAQEDFTYKYTDKEYHFTLYYYDQAGNLIKTIPPEGVEMIDLSQGTNQTDIKNDRTFSTKLFYTNHRLPTTYEYNSLNQLTKQSLPDQERMNVNSFMNPIGLSTLLKTKSIQYLGSTTGYMNTEIVNQNRSYLYKTFDGGDSWSRLKGVLSSSINKLNLNLNSAINSYAVCDDGTWLKSTDAGNTWDAFNFYSQGYTGNLSALYSRLFSSGNDLVLIGGKYENNKGLFYSHDGINFSLGTGVDAGDTITNFFELSNGLYLTSKNTFDWQGNSTNGFEYNEGKIYSSSDDGVTWSKVSNSFGTVADLSCVSGIDSDTVYAAGTNGEFYLGVNKNGINWAWFVQNSGLKKNIKDIVFVSKLTGIALIDSALGYGQIWQTLDGGMTWSLLSVPGAYYNSFSKYNNNIGIFALGIASNISRVFYNSSSGTFGIVDVNSPITTPIPSNNLSTFSGYVGDNSKTIGISTNNSGTTPQLFFSKDVVGSSTHWRTLTILGLSSGSFIKEVKVQKYGTIGEIAFVILRDNSNNLFFQIVNVTNNNGLPITLILVPNSSHSKILDVKHINISDILVYALNATSNKIDKIVFTGLTPSVNPVSQPITGMNDFLLVGNKYLGVGDGGQISISDPLTISLANWNNSSSSLVLPAINDVNSNGSDAALLTGQNGFLMELDVISNTTQFKHLNTSIQEHFNCLDKNNSTDYFIGTNKGNIYKCIGASCLLKYQVSSSPIIDLTYYLDNLYVALSESRMAFVNTLASSFNISYSNNFNISNYPTTFAISPANTVRAGCKGGQLLTFLGTSSMLNPEIYIGKVSAMDFNSPYNGYLISDRGFIRRTIDGGNKWSIVLPDLNKLNGWNNIKSISTYEALIVGNNGYSGLITDNNSPQNIVSNTTNDLLDADFVDGNFGVVTGTNGCFKVFSKGGSAFNYTPLTLSGPAITNSLNTVKLFGDHGALVAGDMGAAFYISKSGDVFPVPLSNLTTSNDVINDIYFHDDRTGYLVGNKGLAIRANLLQNIEHGGVGGINEWQTLNLIDNYSVYTSSTKSTIDINSISFANRYRGTVGGFILPSGGTPTNYCMNINDEMDYFSTRYWYDELGRLILSQNTKQFKADEFSYTMYDYLGRIVESGVKHKNVVVGATFESIFNVDINGYKNKKIVNSNFLYDWILGDGYRKEVTITFYDEVYYSNASIIQENLTNRVAQIIYMDEWESFLSDYKIASYFSYDIHGNVKDIWQENLHVSPIEQQLKHINYEYDLISGKVNKVSYQPGLTDAFYHKYEYDGDNRLLEVYTSKNDILWERDAKYIYYDHGPLARVELGDDGIQGIDYAYTLQGWIKGVNSNLLNPTNDMGKDGLSSITNPFANFARDAYSYSLNYFEGDYEPIGAENEPAYPPTILPTITSSNNFLASLNDPNGTGNMASDLLASSSNLYNGNIKSMVTTLPIAADIPNNGGVEYTNQAQGFAYTYDQLNRIKKAEGFQNINANNFWQQTPPSPPTTLPIGYSTSYTYDANGNIETLTRKDLANTSFDNFSYFYHKNSAGKVISNRLYHVNDAIAAGVEDDDIDDQGSTASIVINQNTNYRYDELGNLSHDEQEEIETITWTASGKLKKIIRKSTSTKPDMEFHYDVSGNRLRKVLKPHGSSVENGGVDDPTLWIASDYSRDPQGNVMAVYESKFENSSHAYNLKERNIYGSARLGVDLNEVDMYLTPQSIISQSNDPQLKKYELSNHLGNVVATVNNYKIAVPDVSGTLIDHYASDVANTSDYYPFGSLLKERTCRWVWMKGIDYLNDPTDVELAFVNMDEPPAGIAIDGKSYRFSFNGMEKDNEVKGVGNSYTTEFRMNDPRLGRWFSIDPITHSWMSPYTSMDNNPIFFIDPFGDEITYQNRKQYREYRRARKKDGSWADVKHKYKGKDSVKDLKIVETPRVDNTMAMGGTQEKDIYGADNVERQDYYYYNSKGYNNGESGAAGSREKINPIQSRSIEALPSTFSTPSPISGQVLALSPPRTPRITVNEPFIPNLPTFVNPVNANRQIRNAANVYLNNLGATQIFITIGTIQTNLNLPMGNGTNLRQLLQQRANIVRNQLIQMGVPAVAFPNDWLRFAPGTSIGTTIRVR